MPSTSVGAGEYTVKSELEVRLRLLRLCIQIAALLLVLAPNVQAAPLTDVPDCV